MVGSWIINCIMFEQCAWERVSRLFMFEGIKSSFFNGLFYQKDHVFLRTDTTVANSYQII